MVRVPRLGREKAAVDPGTPHRFQEIHDSGMAAMVAGGGNFAGPQSAVGSIALTNNYMRKSKCGVPGCAKPIDDPIHDAADGE